MLSRPPSLRQRKKLATRARIIEVAIRIFGKRGLTEPTVEEIAAAAEVGKGTIYNYFSTKEEIVVAFMVDFEARLQSKLAQFTKAKGPAERILSQFVRFQLHQKDPYRDFVRVFMAQLYTRGRELAPHIAEMQKYINPPLEALFRSLMARGLIRADVDLPVLVEILKLLHIGIIAIWINEAAPYHNTMAMLDQEMELFCRGLAPSQPLSSAPGRGPSNEEQEESV